MENDKEKYDTEFRAQSTVEFLEKISDEIKSGFRFTPFIGSGMSHHSGILMGVEFDEYLTYSLFRCVASLEIISKAINKPENKVKKLDILNDGWPQKPTRDQMKVAVDWVREKYLDEVRKELGVDCFELKQSGRDKSAETSLKGNQSKDLLFPVRLSKDYLGNQTSLDISKHLRVPMCPGVLRSEVDESIHQHDERLRKLYAAFEAEKLIIDHSSQPGVVLNSEEYVIEAGIRSLYDWRAVIRFLARIRVKDDEYFIIDEPDQRIIDSFNNQLVKGRQPNLAHHILISLTRPLRIRTWLTTNFDDLIEQALDAGNIPFTILEPGIKSNLPDASLVHSENMLIKLHGGYINTRADFTLDHSPSLYELQTFQEYFYSVRDTKANKYVPSHLLIMGFSGRDKRIIEFFKFTLQRAKEFKLFWVVYNKDDVKNLAKHFSFEEFGDKIFFVESKRTDLLLYELYQKLTLSLPPKGHTYEFVQYVPPVYEHDHQRFEDIDDKEASGITIGDFPVSHLKALLEKLTVQDNGNTEMISEGLTFQTTRTEIKHNFKDGNFFTVSARSGTAKPMHQVFYALKRKRMSCIWIELEDFIGPLSLLSRLLRIISIEMGLNQLEYVLIDIDEWDIDAVYLYVKNIVDTHQLTPNNWNLFLYGRNGAGGCAGWKNKYWTKDEQIKIVNLLQQLSKVGFNVIYMPYDCTREGRDLEKQKFVNFVQNKNSPLQLSESAKKLQENFRTSIEKSAYRYWPKKTTELREVEPKKGEGYEYIISKIVVQGLLKNIFDSIHKGEELEEKSNKLLMFIYASMMFRQSRHPSSFYSEAVFTCPERFNTEEIDNDFLRSEQVSLWMNELKEGVFFRKPGGYAWAYRDIRLGILDILENIGPIHFSKSGRKIDFMAQARARIHFWIGEWYLRTFLTSAHPGPVIESVYHRISTVYFAKYAKPASVAFNIQLSGDEALTKLIHYRYHLIHSSLIEIIKILRISKSSIKFWMLGSVGTRLFDSVEIINALGISQKSNITALKKENIFEEEHAKLKTWFGTLLYSEYEGPKALSHRHQDIVSVVDSHIGEVRNLLISLVSELDDIRIGLLRASGRLSDHSSILEPEIKQKSKMELFNCTLRCQSIEFPNHLTHRLSIPEIRTDYFELQIKEFFALVDMEREPRKNLDEFFEIASPIQPHLELDSNTPLKHGSNLRSKINGFKQDWASLLSNRPGDLLSLISFICDYCYFLVRHGKLEKRVAQALQEKAITDADLSKLGIKVNVETYQSNVKIIWLQVCLLCWLGQDLLKNLHPNLLEFEYPLKLRLLSFYGLALGNLGRYYEAHRRFNEATAYISKSEASKTNLAVLRLRRTETHLMIAKQVMESLEVIEKGDISKEKIEKITNYCWFKRSDSETYLNIDVDYTAATTRLKKDLYRIYAAKLEDAVTSLESTELLLSQVDRSSLWWGQLYLVNLVLIRMGTKTNNEYRSLVFREKKDYAIKATAVFRKGMLVAKDDPFRRLRLVHEYIKAMAALNESKKYTESENTVICALKCFLSMGLDTKTNCKLTDFKKFIGVSRKVRNEKFLNSKANIYLKSVLYTINQLIKSNPYVD